MRYSACRGVGQAVAGAVGSTDLSWNHTRNDLESPRETASFGSVHLQHHLLHLVLLLRPWVSPWLLEVTREQEG